MNNNIPAAAIGGLTLCGVLIRTDTALVIMALSVSATVIIAMIGILRRCYLREKRLQEITERRNRRNASTVPP